VQHCSKTSSVDTGAVRKEKGSDEESICNNNRDMGSVGRGCILLSVRNKR